MWAFTTDKLKRWKEAFFHYFTDLVDLGYPSSAWLYSIMATDFVFWCCPLDAASTSTISLLWAVLSI